MATSTSDANSNNSFWADKFDFPDSATPNPIPTQAIPGSTDNNTTSQANQENYEAAFPYKDGSSEEKRLPPPVDSEGNTIDLQTVDLADISVELFSESFHSAHQLELLNRFGGQLFLGSGNDRIDVVAASDSRAVIILQELTKNDLAQLSLDDQILIVAYLQGSDVPDSVKEQLALTWEVTVGDSVEGNRAAATALIDEAIEAIKSAGSEYDEIYIGQLDAMKVLLQKNALFSEGGIQVQIDEINERFQRMNAFEAVEKQTVINGADGDELFPGLNSLDKNATILSGLEKFLDLERRLLDAQTQRVAFATTVGGLDLATLVASLQLIFNVKQEIIVGILTEELEQQNALLKDYTEIQRIVNDVLSSFSTGEDADTELRDATGLIADDERIITVRGANNLGLSLQDLEALVMFDTFLSDDRPNGSVRHPLEELRGITRPTVSLMDAIETSSADGEIIRFKLNGLSQSEWNIFNTQVSDGQNVANQQSQILTNDISSFNQQQNRHFDLANSALRRMVEMINSIARI